MNYVLEMPVAALAKDFMFYILGLCMNMFLILLVTSYLIFENSAEYVVVEQHGVEGALSLTWISVVMVSQSWCQKPNLRAS